MNVENVGEEMAAEDMILRLHKAKLHQNPVNNLQQFSLLNSLWFAVGSLMQQGSDVIPRAAATRTVAVIWWLFTLIIISSYTAQLAAFLTVERMSTPVESSADLAAQQRIKFGTLSNGSTMEFFRESKIPIYERMWSIMQSTSPSVFVNSSREGISRVRAGNYAYLMESTMLEYWIGEDCQLQTIGGLLDSKGYGIALPKGSPLQRTILEALKNKWWKGEHRYRNSVEGASYGGGCPLPGANSHSSLHRVFGVFYMLFAGILFALLVAIGEFFVESRRRQSLRLGLCLPGRLINWYFGMADTIYDPNNVPHSNTVLRFKGSQLYLDNVPTIVDNDTSDNSEGKMKTTTETGTRKTRLSEYIQSNFNLIKNSSTFGSDSSFSSNALQEGRQEGEIIASSHSASSLEEMDDSLCSLKQYNRFKHHSNCRTITGQPQKIILKNPDTEQSPSFKMRRQSSLADNEQISTPSRRKISEPAAPLTQFPPAFPQRKNSIRNVFYKMSRTPSIVIGADAHNLLALQHLIPPTDERLLNRRQSSQEKFPCQAEQHERK
uniref:Ionotropic glutamate receptor C-terminal domain-containing protein n=1 Tax=Meloidogyne incognita TaxID=6306 RepID=A0A914LT21_MELIC